MQTVWCVSAEDTALADEATEGDGLVRRAGGAVAVGTVTAERTVRWLDQIDAALLPAGVLAGLDTPGRPEPQEPLLTAVRGVDTVGAQPVGGCDGSRTLG